MISIVIPVLNEGRLLPGCLENLLPRVRRVGGELIVVDGGSDDDSATIGRIFTDLRLVESDRGRGLQMNRGALKARGTLLVFVPVDTRLSPGLLRHLQRIDRDAAPVAGSCCGSSPFYPTCARA